MSLQIITANRLGDGLVVYFTDQGTWSTDIDEADQRDDPGEIDALLAQASDAANQLLVVGPYVIDVHIQDSKLVPVRYREILRTKGPSVRLDLGYQSET